MSAHSHQDELMAMSIVDLRSILRGHAKLGGSKARLVQEILRLGLYPGTSGNQSTAQLGTVTQTYRITILHNKYVSGYAFYFRAAGVGAPQPRYKFKPKWNYVVTATGASPQAALRSVLQTNPFMEYFKCKYQEPGIAEKLIIDPKQVFGQGELLRKYGSIAEVDIDDLFGEDELRSTYMYSTPLARSEIRAQFTSRELFMLDVYASDYARWRNLARTVYASCRSIPPMVEVEDLSPEEWDRLIYIEMTYGSIEVHPL